MPEIITTKDGKNHTLVGSTSLISIIAGTKQPKLVAGGRLQSWMNLNIFWISMALALRKPKKFDPLSKIA